MKRGKQLNHRTALGPSQHRFPHALLSVFLGVGADQPQGVGVELDGLVQVRDGNTDVINAKDHVGMVSGSECNRYQEVPQCLHLSSLLELVRLWGASWVPSRA